MLETHTKKISVLLSYLLNFLSRMTKRLHRLQVKKYLRKGKNKAHIN